MVDIEGDPLVEEEVVEEGYLVGYGVATLFQELPCPLEVSRPVVVLPQFLWPQGLFLPAQGQHRYDVTLSTPECVYLGLAVKGQGDGLSQLVVVEGRLVGLEVELAPANAKPLLCQDSIWPALLHCIPVGLFAEAGIINLTGYKGGPLCGRIGDVEGIDPIQIWYSRHVVVRVPPELGLNVPLSFGHDERAAAYGHLLHIAVPLHHLFGVDV